MKDSGFWLGFAVLALIFMSWGFIVGRHVPTQSYESMMLYFSAGYSIAYMIGGSRRS